MTIYTNELSHITNMATLPIYGKNLKKIFSRTTRPKMFAFGLYTQVSDSGPHGPLVYLYITRITKTNDMPHYQRTKKEEPPTDGQQ